MEIEPNLHLFVKVGIQELNCYETATHRETMQRKLGQYDSH